MNKHDCFSIEHLIIYLCAEKKLRDKDIIFWTDLKRLIERCNHKNLSKETPAKEEA